MKPFKLSPKAEELLARIEARKGAARTNKTDTTGDKKREVQKPLDDFTLGPNPLDFLK
jgi:hypothetical protein